VAAPRALRRSSCPGAVAPAGPPVAVPPAASPDPVRRPGAVRCSGRARPTRGLPGVRAAGTSSRRQRGGRGRHSRNGAEREQDRRSYLVAVVPLGTTVQWRRGRKALMARVGEPRSGTRRSSSDRKMTSSPGDVEGGVVGDQVEPPLRRFIYDETFSSGGSTPLAAQGPVYLSTSPPGRCAGAP